MDDLSKTAEVIVVLDDNVACRVLLKAYLAHCEVPIYECTESQELTDLLPTLGSAKVLLFCDLSLVNEDGLQVLMRLRGDFPNMCSVVLSACDPKIMGLVRGLAQSMELPVLDCVAKPSSEPEILALITKWRSRRQPLIRELLSPLDSFGLAEALRLGQFRPYYQPIVNAINHEISGVEALARLVHRCAASWPLKILCP